MALIDANGNTFNNLTAGRVKYTAESTQSVIQDDSIQLPKAPDLIKSQLTAGATDVFFDSGTDYTPKDVLKDSIEYSYGDTIYYNKGKEINLIFLSEATSEPCTTIMKDFVEFEAPPLLTFQTNKSGTFNPQLPATSGTYIWDYGDGSPLDATNTPNHTYSDSSTKTVIVYQNTANNIIQGFNFRNQNIIGSMDLSPFAFSLNFLIDTNSGLTGLTFSASGNTANLFRAHSCNISSIDLSGFTISGDIECYSNANLATATFSASGNTTNRFRFENCNLSSLDVSGFTLAQNFYVNNNSSLSSITFSGSNSSFDFRINDCNFSSIDVSSFTFAGGNTYFYNNSSLSSITFAASGNASAEFRIDNCNFTTIDVSSFEFRRNIFMFNNSSLSSITWNGTNPITTGLASVRLEGCALSIAEVDEVFSIQDGFFTTGGANDPIKNLTTDTSGGTNGIPTGGVSNVNIASLVSKYTTEGFLYTAIINT